MTLKDRLEADVLLNLLTLMRVCHTTIGDTTEVRGRPKTKNDHKPLGFDYITVIIQGNRIIMERVLPEAVRVGIEKAIEYAYSFEPYFSPTVILGKRHVFSCGEDSFIAIRLM